MKKKRLFPGLLASLYLMSTGLLPAYAQMPEEDQEVLQEEAVTIQEPDLLQDENSQPQDLVFQDQSDEADLDDQEEDEYPVRFITGSNEPETWQIKDSARYYIAKNGLPVTGWKLINQEWFYFDPSTSEMQTGLRRIGNDDYYLDPQTGKMMTGVVDVPDVGLCYFSNDGARRTGWKLINKIWYYFSPETCLMETGLQTIKNEVYYLEPGTGRMLTGFLDIPGQGIMYFNADGARKNGWFKIDGIWYYSLPETGILQKGKQKIDGKWYLLDDQTGKMYTGLLKVGNDLYNYSNTGAMSQGWALINGDWYYHNKETGIREYGEKEIDGKIYFLDPAAQGKMMTGWKQVDGNWILYSTSGDQQFGFASRGGHTYYLDEKTGYLHYGDFSMGHAAYHLNSDGAILSSYISDVTYLMQTDSRWAMDIINSYTIGSTGCVPTVLTMIYNTLTDSNMLPPELCVILGKEGLLNGALGAGCGDNAVAFFGDYYNLKVEPVRSLSELKHALKSGKLIAAAMDGGLFTNPGSSHEVMVYGYENGYTNVMDPFFNNHNGTYLTDVVWGERSAEDFNCMAGGPVLAISRY